jgi:hypothetical protein
MSPLIANVEQISAYNILSYGVIGLGFLLALLAFRLLGNEQRKDQPSKSILVSIHVFMIFSILLCVLGFASEYFHGGKSSLTSDQDATNKLNEQVALLQTQVGAQEKDLGRKEKNLQKYRDNQAQIFADSKKAREVCKKLVDFLPKTFGLKQQLQDIIDLLTFIKVEEE